MQLVFLFHLDLILHAYKILIRCDSFGILNFASKQGVNHVGAIGSATNSLGHLG